MATNHTSLAKAVRLAVESEAGETATAIRHDVLRRAAGGQPIAQPYEDLAKTIAEAPYRVTDAQVSAVRRIAGSDKAAFEMVMSACIGSGLARWDRAIKAMEEAENAAP